MHMRVKSDLAVFFFKYLMKKCLLLLYEDLQTCL